MIFNKDIRKLTKEESDSYNKIVNEIIEEINPNLQEVSRKVVSSLKKKVKPNKKNMESILLVHREILKYLLLYPIKSIRIGKMGKKKINDGASYTYNITLSKDIIDTEMIESGASEKLAEAIFKADQGKVDRNQIDYIG